MFDLAMPWWEFAVRGAACYLGLLALLRLTGRRSFGEMAPFDIVVLVIVGGALRSAMVGKDASLLGPLIVVVTILTLDKLLGWRRGVRQSIAYSKADPPCLHGMANCCPALCFDTASRTQRSSGSCAPTHCVLCTRSTKRAWNQTAALPF